MAPRSATALNIDSFFSLIVFLSFSYCSLYFVLAAHQATRAGHRRQGHRAIHSIKKKIRRVITKNLQFLLENQPGAHFFREELNRGRRRIHGRRTGRKSLFRVFRGNPSCLWLRPCGSAPLRRWYSFLVAILFRRRGGGLRRGPVGKGRGPTKHRPSDSSTAWLNWPPPAESLFRLLPTVLICRATWRERFAPRCARKVCRRLWLRPRLPGTVPNDTRPSCESGRSEEHTSELQSLRHLVFPPLPQ